MHAPAFSSADSYDEPDRRTHACAVRAAAFAWVKKLDERSSRVILSQYETIATEVLPLMAGVTAIVQQTRLVACRRRL
jgi:hypothetical protein